MNKGANQWASRWDFRVEGESSDMEVRSEKQQNYASGNEELLRHGGVSVGQNSTASFGPTPFRVETEA